MPSDTALFLRRLIKKPFQIMALAPSSDKLADLMAAAVPAGDGPVVELGPGTGTITRALIAAGVAQGDLTLFEMDPTFVDHLKDQFPKADVRLASATTVGQSQLTGARAVVSGLPLLSMSEPVQRDIVGGAFEILQPGGVYIQFTYGPKSPVRSAITQELGLTYTSSRRVWGNLPPARVYTFAQPRH